MSASTRLTRHLHANVERVIHPRSNIFLARAQYRGINTSLQHMAPKLLVGADSTTVESDISSLLSSGWILTPNQDSIEKTYHFKVYTKVLDLHHLIGVASKAKNHHATMISKFGSLTVTWTTHEPAPGGLGKKDVGMARWCDEQAKLIGTVDKSASAKCGPIASS